MTASGAATARKLSLPELTIDQGLYSASNFALAALAGHALAVDDFGRFAAAALVGAILTQLVRAVWHEPDLTVRTPLAAGPARAQRVASALAVIVAVAGLGLAPTATTAVAAGAIGVTLVQDRARYVAIAAGRVGPLLAGEVAWLAVVVGALAVGPFRFGPHGVFGIWLLGAAAGLAPHVAPTPDQPTRPPGSSRRYPAEPIDEVSRSGRSQPGRRLTLLIDFALLTGTTQLGGLLLGLVLPLQEFAALRGAIIAYGPVGIAIAAVSTWVFTSGSTDGWPVEAVARRTVAIAAASAVLVVGLSVTPADLGVAVLGSGWPPPWVLVSIGASVTGQAVSGPGFALLRLADARRPLLTLRLTGLVVFVAATLALAATAGTATAVAAGYALTNALLALAVWLAVASIGRSAAVDRAGEGESGQTGDGQDRGRHPVEG